MPEDISSWLEELGLGRYAQAFAENDIDLRALPHLSDDDLRELGLSLGHRRILQGALADIGNRDDAVRSVAPEPGDGAPLEGERRQVTVMFADLAGFTRMSSERDAEDVHAVLDRFFGLVDRLVVDHGGSVDKHMGDCVMAVFGAPVAHGDDPARAALCALAIERSVPELGRALGCHLGIHIGVAAGEVVASRTGSAEHMTYTVTGDAVNLAARLADRAAEGETLISQAVLTALGDTASCDPVGEVPVKGLSSPVKVWRLTGLVAGRAAPSDRPFVGRRSEIAQIGNALQTCLADSRGLTLVVRGDVGIGKTRLVEETVRHAETLGYRFHKGLVLDFGTSRGQDAIRSIVRDLLDVAAPADEETRSRAADHAVAEGRIAAESRVYLNDLLDLRQPPDLESLYNAMDKPVRDAGLRSTLCALVRGASALDPRVIVVEDVHWADADTLGHLAALATTVAECRALLVMTTRVEGDPIDRAWRAACAAAPTMTIDLAPLRPEEARQLAREFTRFAAEVADKCVERSGGNPLFLDLLLRSAEEAAEDEIPGSIRSIVLARMDRLPAEERRALQAAAVLGQRSSREEIQAVAGDSRATCAELVNRLLMRPDGEALLFSHALIRDAVYDSLLRPRRQELHARAAAWFEDRDPTLFAQHLDRADDARAPRAYLAAAEQEAERYHVEQARRLVERGLEIATDLSDRARLTTYLGELLLDLGQADKARGAFETALSHATDDAERCRAHLGLASAMRLADRLDVAMEQLDAAQAAAERAGLDLEKSQVHYLRGNLFFPMGKIDSVRREHETAFRLARATGSVEAEARALGGLGDAAYVSGRMLTAHDHFVRCCDLARQHGFGRIEAANRPMAAVTAHSTLDIEGAMDQASAAVEFAMQVGHMRGEIIARHVACIAHVLRCEIDAGRRAVDEVQALTKRLGARRFEAENLMFLAEVLIIAGDRAKALPIVEEAMEISRETGIGYIGPSILAVIAASTDDPARRDAAIAEGESLLAGGAISHNVFWFRRYAIDTMLRAGDWDAADGHAQALDDYTREERLPWMDFVIARSRTLAALGRNPVDATARDEAARLVGVAERVGLRQGVDELRAALATADGQ